MDSSADAGGGAVAVADQSTGAAKNILPVGASGRRSIGGYVFMPLVLAGVLLVLYLWVNSKTLDSMEEQRLNAEFIRTATWEHIQLTAVSTLFVLIIAIPLGILLTRPALGRITRPAIGVFNIGAALPTIGVIVLFAAAWDVGFWPVVVALVAYTSIVVLRNTMVGLQQVDAAVIESARGMGMTRRSVLVRIELPLAVPIIMAGIRTALVINVGTAALATLVSGGGLGDIINAGIVSNRPTITVTGSVLAAVLALTIDYLAGLAEDLLRPKGL